MHGGDSAGGLRRNPDGRFERSSPPRAGMQLGRAGDDAPMPGRFDRPSEDLRGGRGGERGGGFFRGAPPDDFRRESWNGRGRGGPPDRDDHDRGRFREPPPGMGRGGPGGREERLSRSDLAAERARVCHALLSTVPVRETLSCVPSAPPR